MQKPYHKYMTETWVQKEAELEAHIEQPGFNPYTDEVLRHALIPASGIWGQMSISCGMMGYYEYKSGKKIMDFNSILEVGGGFGHLCRLCRGMFRGSYHTVDIPVMTRIQKGLLGDLAMCHSIEEMGEIPDCDFFISIFALNETTPDMMEYVLSRKLFGAKHWFIYGGKDDGGGFKGLAHYAQRIGGHVEEDGIFLRIWN